MWNYNLCASPHRSVTAFWESVFIFTSSMIYLASTGSNSSEGMEAQTGGWCLKTSGKLKETIPFYDMKTGNLFQS